MNNVHVENMTSPRTGKAVANQFIIRTTEGRYFQSYDSVIAFIPNSLEIEQNNTKIVLDRQSWDYSKTTNKYRNIFLGEPKVVTQSKIDKGEYELSNLNSISQN